jgi:deoxyribonuclease V
MKLFYSHPWNVNLDEAKRIQEELSRYVVREDSFKKIKTLGGVGINFGRSFLIVSIAKFSYPDLDKLDLFSDKFPISFPYIPNFFAFSCGPAILSLLRKIELPDLLIFPGKGIAHPRGVGLASHLGVLLDLPTVACSKRPIVHNYPEPGKTKGLYEFIFEKGEKAGLALRSRDNTNPIFISPGNKISIGSSLKIVLNCCTKYRLPEPLRQAQISARKEMQKSRARL